MVGPSKTDRNLLRETDGERFFEIHKQVEFAKDSHSVAMAFATLKTQW